MPDEQLGFFGEATPLDQLGPREVRAGGRGGSTEAASIPDKPEKYLDVLHLFGRHSHADFEVATELPGVHPGTLCKRRLRLERAGLVEEVPGVMRATPHGVGAMTFRITTKGREVLHQWRQALSASSNGKTPPTAPAPTSGSSMPSGMPPVSGRSSDVV